MIAKEWRDARWKLLLAVVAFLAFAALVPRSYDKLQADVERQIRWTQQDLRSSSNGQGPFEGLPVEERRRLEVQQREELRDMQRLGFAVETARGELRNLQQVGNFGILLPLAGLLGVALVSGEVSRGSILLLLSKPASRDHMLLIKYAVGAACLLVVALLGAVGIIVSAHAKAYPSEAVDLGRIFGSAALIWLGSLFVLGVALLASVLFRDVVRTIVAAAVTLYIVFSLPEILRIPLEVFWLNGDYQQTWRAIESWYRFFQIFRLYDYWSLSFYGPFGGQQNGPLISVAVCIVTAAIPLIASLWLFRRKAY